MIHNVSCLIKKLLCSSCMCLVRNKKKFYKSRLLDEIILNKMQNVLWEGLSPACLMRWRMLPASGCSCPCGECWIPVGGRWSHATCFVTLFLDKRVPSLGVFRTLQNTCGLLAETFARGRSFRDERAAEEFQTPMQKLKEKSRYDL